MRYSLAFAGALLLALSASVQADDIRDAGSKVRGNWQNFEAPTPNNGRMVYRSYSVAPSAPASVAAPAPAAPAPEMAQSQNGAQRSYSYQPAQPVYSYNYNRALTSARVAPYLRADHKVKAEY
jgi:hypothetical protein